MLTLLAGRAIRCHVKRIMTIIVSLLPATAWAQPLPVPRVGGPGGGCPVGYSWQGRYCITAGQQHRAGHPEEGYYLPTGMDGQRQLLHQTMTKLSKAYRRWLKRLATGK